MGSGEIWLMVQKVSPNHADIQGDEAADSVIYGNAYREISQAVTVSG
jgi:hypothetical protein